MDMDMDMDMVKCGGTGDFGGGWLERPRQWLRAQWPDLYPGCAEPPPEPPGAP